MKIRRVNLHSFQIYNYNNVNFNKVVNSRQHDLGNNSIPYYLPLNFGKKLSAEKISNNDSVNMEIVYKLDDDEFHDIVSFADAAAFAKYNKDNGISTYLVKDEKNKLIGYYQICEAKNGNLFIDTINLNPEYRGKHTGFTTFVFKNITDTAKKSGADKLSLLVASRNHHAQNLYKRIGFKLAELQKAKFNNDDALYMEKALA